jgi:hypothetical protein
MLYRFAFLFCAAMFTCTAAQGQMFIQQGGKLVGSGGKYASQGNSVALSGDGNTALVGGPSDGSTGAVWVFTRNNTGNWTQQGSKLVGRGAAFAAEQGTSVALSADGNTALIGGPGDVPAGGGYPVGAVWVFTRDSNGNWTQQGSKLVGDGYSGYPGQGSAVALSADGNTALVGGPSDAGPNVGVGAVWVFTRDSRGNWTQQGSKLVGSGVVGFGAEQGDSVALSADGNTALVGGFVDNNGAGGGVGAVWVFTRDSNGNWTQQGSKLVGSGAAGWAEQGSSVAISGDGNTALVGGRNDNNGAGAVWVFARDSNGNWTQQGSKLVGSGAVGSAGQGCSVALSADGHTALVGGRYDNSGAGAVWVFRRNSGNWIQQGSKVVGSGAVGSHVLQGSSVALSGDGTTALIGGADDNSGVGAVWIFTAQLSGAFEVVSAHTGQVLEAPNGASANGTLIAQNYLNGYEQQQWQFIPVGGGYYEIQNMLTGKVLDVTGASVGVGTRIQEWDYLGGANQQWQLVPVDDVHYQIVNRNSGLVLDVIGGSTASGTNVQQWTYLGDPQQLWVMVPVQSYTIANKLSTYVLDLSNGSSTDGTLIQQSGATGYWEQQWQFVPVGGGYFAILNRNSGKVLDVIAASISPGTLIQQWDYLGGANQQWQLVKSDGTSYQIMNRASGYVLDDIAYSTTAGTRIQQWPFEGSDNQLWQVAPVQYYNIENRNSRLVLDVAGGSTTAGTHIQQWGSNGLQQQGWQLLPSANGSYVIMNNVTSQVLDVTNGSSSDGALIQQQPFNGSAEQQWKLVPVGAGYYEIQNVNSGKVLDMTGASVSQGALLQQWDYLGSTNQQWQLIPVAP